MQQKKLKVQNFFFKKISNKKIIFALILINLLLETHETSGILIIFGNYLLDIKNRLTNIPWNTQRTIHITIYLA